MPSAAICNTFDPKILRQEERSKRVDADLNAIFHKNSERISPSVTKFGIETESERKAIHEEIDPVSTVGSRSESTVPTTGGKVEQASEFSGARLQVCCQCIGCDNEPCHKNQKVRK